MRQATRARRPSVARKGRPGRADARTAGLLASSLKRKESSRERLLASALARFCRDGYVGVSIEDIAAEADVSRVTFYRHFSDKAALAAELFAQEAAAASPRFLAIRDRAYDEREVIVLWLRELFAADRENRQLLRVFMQATSDQRFTLSAQDWIVELIAGLGEAVPAFAARYDAPPQRRRWLEAWLLVYEILDQSNHAALQSGVANDPIVIEILADRFLAFVQSHPSK